MEISSNAYIVAYYQTLMLLLKLRLLSECGNDIYLPTSPPIIVVRYNCTHSQNWSMDLKAVFACKLQQDLVLFNYIPTHAV